MPSLMMYLVEEDVSRLCRMLDADEEIALIRPDGPGRWRAHREVPTLPDGEYALWHVPSGPIYLDPVPPKVRQKMRQKKVANPFAGWTEIAKPFTPGQPWLGAAPLGIFWLAIRRTAGPAGTAFRPFSMARPWSAPAPEVIGRSDFHWVGNYYSIIGERAPEATVRWWESLRGRFAKVATQIPVTGPINRKPKEAWAFPAALAQIRAGRKRADNPA